MEDNNHKSKGEKCSLYFMGCIGICALGVVLLLMIFTIVTHHTSDNLFYVEKEGIYVWFVRNGSGTTGLVYLGNTLDDIDQKLDCFEIERTEWDAHSVSFVKGKNNDSIFVEVPSPNYFHLVSSHNFSISLLVPNYLDVNIVDHGEVKKSSVIDENYNKRFRDCRNNYILHIYNWDSFDYEDNSLMVVDEYCSGMIDLKKVEKIPSQ